MFRSLGLAAVGCLLLSGALFLLFYLLTNNTNLAGSIAAIPVLATNDVAKIIERHGPEKLRIKNIVDYTYGRFEAPWWITLIYSCVGTYLVMFGATFIAAFLVTSLVTRWPPEIVGPAVASADIPLGMIGAYYIGKWVGVRGGTYGAAIFVLAVFITMSLSHGWDMLFLSDDAFANLYGGKLRSAALFIGATIGGCIIFLIAGCAGYIRGKLARRSEYVRHLLGLLRPTSKDALLDLIHSEALLISAAQEAPIAVNPDK